MRFEGVFLSVIFFHCVFNRTAYCVTAAQSPGHVYYVLCSTGTKSWSLSLVTKGIFME